VNTAAIAPWLTLALLGAWHGANPGMGWLFAVSRGLQERRAGAVAAALPPIALGHALAIVAALAVLALGKFSLDPQHLRWVIAAVLVGFGVLKLVRHRHPRWVGMQVGFRDLTLWSFLMATAHGAGLMLLPLFLGEGGLTAGPDTAPACHTAAAGLAGADASGYAAAVLVHTLAMLLVAGAVAFLVYYKLGLALLRKAWFNVEWLWAAALILAGGVALVA
jgi:hypothetical protein